MINVVRGVHSWTISDIPAPESEMDVSHSESEVEYIEPDSASLQIKTMAEQLLCPLVVAQTRPMEAVTQPRPVGCVGDVMS